MERSDRTVRDHQMPNFHLVQLNIYLFNPGISPGLINPDFLRYNEIVDPAWQIERPVMFEPGSSRVRYSNGLSLSAYENHFVVSQYALSDSRRSTITPLTPDNVLCVEVAERYLNLVPADLPYETVSIDPVGWIDIPGEEVSGVSSPLQEIAERIQIEDATPDVHARAIFDIDGKRITLYASEIPLNGSRKMLRLRFAGEIIRNIEEGEPDVQVSSIAAVLDNWAQDIDDFESIASQFYSLYIARES